MKNIPILVILAITLTHNSHPRSRYQKLQESKELNQEIVQSQPSLHGKGYGEPAEKPTTLLDVFCAPIIFSDAGFRCYIKHRYNRAEYTDFLSLCFHDMVEFLAYGTQQQARDYPKRIISMFHKKLKSTSYINAFSFDELLKDLPTLLKQYFTSAESDLSSLLKKNIHQLLYSSFLNSFDEFKKEPQNFLENISQTLATMALQELAQQEQVSQNELRSVIIRFLEQGLAKLVWSPDEGLEVWNSIKSLSEHLEDLGTTGIFEYEEDLDDLYWSLISRFSYFIELTGAELSLEVYQKIREDIESNNLPFLTVDEQEDYVETKKDYLLRTIKIGATKAQAHAMGFVSEIIA